MCICTNTRASHFLRRVATYISSTPFCGRASSTKNCVAHHDKRKVKPYERSRSYLSFLREKTIVTSNYADRKKKRQVQVQSRCPFSFLLCLFPSFLFYIFVLFPPISSSEWSTRSSRRDSIIAALSQLYGRVRVTIVKRESPNDSRYYPAADNEVHYPNAAAGGTGFVRHTTMVNPGSTCSGIILASAIHLLSATSRWKTRTTRSSAYNRGV